MDLPMYVQVAPNARVTCKNEGVSVFVITTVYLYLLGPIVLKFRMHVGTRLAMYFHVAQLGSTCARARIVPRSRERLNRLRSNLVQ